MGTDENQPAEKSLNEDLAAAFEEYEVEDEESPREGTESEDVSESDESGEDTDKVGEGEDSSGESEREQSDDDEPADKGDGESLAPPDHWSAEDKETFAKAPKDVQEWALRRHKEMEADYTRKTQEIAEFKREFEPIEQMFAPHKAYLRTQGLTPADVVQRWHAAEQFLTEQPVEAIKWLAGNYGVDINQLAQQEQPSDPQIQQLNQKIAGLESQLTQRQQAEVQQRQSQIMNEIQSFASETDEAGKPAHPYFEDVMEDMVSLARAEQAAGRTPVLKDLYDKAVWANPQVREQVLSAQRKAAEEKQAQEARAKAAAAKKAAKSVSGQPSGSTPSSDDLGLRESLEQAFN